MAYTFPRASRWFRAALGAALGACLACLAPAAQGADEPLEASSYAVAIQGRVTEGRMQRFAVEEKRSAENVLIFQRSVHLTLLDPESGDPAPFASHLHAVEKPDGTLIHYTLNTLYGSRRLDLQGRLSGGRLVILRQLDGGAQQRSEHPVPGPVTGPWALEKRLRARPFEKDVVVEARLMVFETGRTALFRFEGKGPETLSLPLLQGRFYRVEVSSEALEHPYVQWRDDRGRLAASSLAGPSEIMTYRIRGEDAPKPAPAPPLPPTAPRPVTLSGEEDFSADMHWKLTGDVPSAWDLEAPSQTVSKRGKGFVVVAVSGRREEPKARRPLPLREDLLPFLGETPFVDAVLSPRSVERVEEALRGEEQAWTSALHLAADLAGREGAGWNPYFLEASRYDMPGMDLSPWGKALLLVSRCRTAGVPARMVGGMRIGPDGAAPDLWAEIYAGAWVGLDTQPLGSHCVRLLVVPLDESAPETVRAFLASFARLAVEKTGS